MRRRLEGEEISGPRNVVAFVGSAIFCHQLADASAMCLKPKSNRTFWQNMISNPQDRWLPILQSSLPLWSLFWGATEHSSLTSRKSYVWNGPLRPFICLPLRPFICLLCFSDKLVIFLRSRKKHEKEQVMTPDTKNCYVGHGQNYFDRGPRSGDSRLGRKASQSMLPFERKPSAGMTIFACANIAMLAESSQEYQIRLLYVRTVWKCFHAIE